MVRLGVDILINKEILKGSRIALLTNMLSTTSALVPTLDALLHQGYRIEKVFVPEHGLWGAALAGEKVSDFYDDQRRIPIVSLYGSRQKPDPEELKGLDAVVVDLPDVGCRFYTYQWTLTWFLESVYQARVPAFLCDRPNPINGEAVEGPCQKEIWGSLVGRFPIPIRHGLTIGELALWATHFRLKADDAQLQVIPCEGWRRSLIWDETGLPFVPPSPALTSPSCALLYPGTCLLEGTNLSEGRGTGKPFEWVGAPFIKEKDASDLLNDLGLSGVLFRPHRFLPSLSKHANTLCRGVQIHILDPKSVQPIRIGICLIAALKTLARDHFAWLAPTFDRLWGSSDLRESLDRSADPIQTALEWDLSPDSHYLSERGQILLYS